MSMGLSGTNMSMGLSGTNMSVGLSGTNMSVGLSDTDTVFVWDCLILTLHVCGIVGQ